MAGVEWVVTGILGLPYQVYVGIVLVLAVFYYKRVLNLLGMITKMGWYTVVSLAVIGVFLGLGWLTGFNADAILGDLSAGVDAIGRVLRAVMGA